MEIKKDPRVDLKTRKQTYWLTGLTGILAVLFIMFEWTNVTHNKIRDRFGFDDMFIDDDVAITVQTNTPPPPPPPPIPDVIEEILVVDNEKEVDELDFVSIESDENMEVAILSQTDEGPVIEDVADDNEIFVIVEQQPEYPGGMQALMQYLTNSIRYPAFEAENGIQGRVTLSFVVERDGSISDIVEMRSPSEGLTREARRVVQNMPKWRPGKQRGKAVRVKYMLPVTFRLS